VGQAFAARLEAAGSTCVRVTPGPSYAVSEQGAVTINPEDPSDYERLCREFSNSLDRVVHFWGLDGEAGGDISVDTLERARILGCGSALHLSHAIYGATASSGRAAATPGRRLWFVTRGAQPAADSEPQGPLQAPLWGFGRCLALEHADLWGGLIDLDRLNYYDPAEFWDAVNPGRGGGIILDPGAFYILVSRESVHIPPDCAAEMAPYMAVAGEFRVHYAGFFDPGFGHGAAGGAGSRAVLEVRCFEAPFALEHGQVVGRLVYEPMLETPDILYGQGIGSTYHAQGLRLSKHFRA